MQVEGERDQRQNWGRTSHEKIVSPNVAMQPHPEEPGKAVTEVLERTLDRLCGRNDSLWSGPKRD